MRPLEPVTFRSETLAKLDADLREGETREHLLSIAIEHEISRRLVESIIKSPLGDKSV